MATKTITIDVEAYDRLKGVQKPDESFSKTIKRVIRKPVDWQAFFKRVDKSPASPEFLTAVEEQVAGRRAAAPRKR